MEAFFQLAHEAVHLLCPVDERNVNNLEEGAAEAFALNFVRVELGRFDYEQKIPSYQRAYDAVKPLLDGDPDCIRRLRQINRCLATVTKAQLKEAIPWIDDDTVEFLLSPFVRGE